MWSILLKNLYFLFILIVSMDGSSYYSSRTFLVARLVAALLIIVLYRPKFDKVIIQVLLVWMAFVFACFVLAGDPSLTLSIRFAVMFIEAYTLIKVFGKQLFSVFTKSMVILAAISLVGWVLSVIDMEGIFDLMYKYDLSGGYRESAADYAHVLVFSLHKSISNWVNIPRNSGFCWEPGPYSVILVLALFMRNGLLKRKYSQLGSLLMVAALATTFSTTGYLAFFAYLIYEYWLKTRRVIYLIPLLAIIISSYYAFNRLQFLGSKVEIYSETGAYVVQREGSERLTGSRFGGLPIVIEDLRRNPLMGKALRQEGYYQFFGEIISSHLNSLSSITSSMGLFGLFWWLFFLIKSSFLISRAYNHEAKFSLAIIILFSSFGFNVHIWSIVITFVLFGIISSERGSRTQNFMKTEPIEQFSLGSEPSGRR